jgi:hypothetical protein
MKYEHPIKKLTNTDLAIIQQDINERADYQLTKSIPTMMNFVRLVQKEYPHKSLKEKAEVVAKEMKYFLK